MYPDDLNEQLAHIVAQTRRPRRLAICAHEIGHALLELAGGGGVDYIELKYKFINGLSGWCHYEEDACQADRLGWSIERKTARLITIMAGHAAEVRFCRLYLDMDERAAFGYGLDWAEGDYQTFYHFRRKFRLHISSDWAFHRAGMFLDRHADRLDRLTVRLHNAGSLAGAVLPNTAGAR